MGDLAFGDDLTQRLQWAKNMCVLFTSLAKDESGQSDTTRQAHITAEGLQPVDAATTGLADRVTARLEQGDLALLPHVLHLDGVALVHVHGGDGGAVAETLHAAFGTRPWAGRWRATGPTGGLLLLLADGDPGWGPIPDGIRLGPDTTVALLGG